jgi:hypothetical protein
MPDWALDVSIDALALSTRCQGLLLRHGIETVGDLTRLTSDEVLRWRYFGQGRLKELSATVKLFLLREAAQQEWREHPLQRSPELVSMVDLARLSLLAMSEQEAIVLMERTGFHGSRKTLQQIADELRLCRERIRQIEFGIVKNYRRLNVWVDAIAPRIGELLKTSGPALCLEDLEQQDSWFAGISAQPDLLRFLLKNFCASQMRLLVSRGKFMVAAGGRTERPSSARSRLGVSAKSKSSVGISACERMTEAESYA